MSFPSLIRESVVGLGRHLQLYLTDFIVQLWLLVFSITSFQAQCSLLHGRDIPTCSCTVLNQSLKKDFALVSFLNIPCLLHLRNTNHLCCKYLGLSIFYRVENLGWSHRMGQNSNPYVIKMLLCVV